MTTQTSRPYASRTPAQKHAAARQSQALSRLGGMLILLLALGAPAFVVGVILYAFVAANRRSHLEAAQTQIVRRRYAIVLLGMLVGMAVIWLGYKTILAQGQLLIQIGRMYQPFVAQLLKAPSKLHWQALRPAIPALWPQLRTLWLMLLPIAPCIAVYLESTRIKPLAELRLEKEQQGEARDRMKRRAAAQKVKRAPEQIKGKSIIGAPLGGALPDWRIKDWVSYPAELLNRHAVIVGGSGTGKTEFLLRLAYLVAKVLKWQVFYIDAKGDVEVANRFMTMMVHGDIGNAAMFPDLAYRGWRGDATAILNRLMAIEDYSEPYYRAIAKTVLSIACHAPCGPPRSSMDLLDRLNATVLTELYAGYDDQRVDTLNTLTDADFAGVYKRYFGFFDALGRKLDGSWSFDTVDAGYILLDGLALKEEARSLGRYLLEDFAHYVSKRKKTDKRVLLIVDEWSAISRGGVDAANLFERVRSYGAGIVVTSQSYEGLGADAAKLVGAAWATIAFQCTDPEAIAARAGTVREVQSTLQTELTAIPGRNTLLSGREHLSGISSQREQEVFRLHPNVIRNLGVGECCIITNGAYLALRVARLPAMLDLGMRWGRSMQEMNASTSMPPRRAKPVSPSGNEETVKEKGGSLAGADANQERDVVCSAAQSDAPVDAEAAAQAEDTTAAEQPQEQPAAAEPAAGEPKSDGEGAEALSAVGEKSEAASSAASPVEASDDRD
jgi:hypothetical protein